MLIRKSLLLLDASSNNIDATVLVVIISVVIAVAIVGAMVYSNYKKSKKE